MEQQLEMPLNRTASGNILPTLGAIIQVLEKRKEKMRRASLKQIALVRDLDR